MGMFKRLLNKFKLALYRRQQTEKKWTADNPAGTKMYKQSQHSSRRGCDGTMR